MYKIRNNRLIIYEIPKKRVIRWFLLFLIKKSEKILIVDNSFFDFVDRESRIESFISWLKGEGVSVININVIKLYDNDKEAWSANIDSINESLNWVAPLRQSSGDSYYLAGYLAHRLQSKIAITSYHRRLDHKLGFNDSNAKDWTSKIVSTRYIENLFSFLFALLLTILLPAFLLWKCRKYISIKLRSQQIKYGGVCVDLMHGAELDYRGLSPIGKYTDTFFLEPNGFFSIKNHSFLVYGWFGEHIKKSQDLLGRMGASVFGLIENGIRVSVGALFGLSIINIARWIKLSFLLSAPVGGWTLLSRWNSLLFQLELFNAQLVFSQVNPDVYFSRLDYSYRHHAIGAECKKRAISYIGINHSPSGGAGYTPNMAIISFDKYLVYTSMFWTDFYPSWQMHTQTELIPVGAWRSDFIYQARNSAKLRSESNNIKEKLRSRFIIGVHLPVPQTFLFDKATTKYWMSWVSKILDCYDDVYLVLFPRRIHQAPSYFHELIDAMISAGRCDLATTIQHEWKQSYPWLNVCDMIIGCNYSDTVLEALAAKVPAFSYVVTGKDISVRQSVDSNLAVYDGESLLRMVDNIRNSRWPESDSWSNIKDQLTGDMCANSIYKIKKIIIDSVNVNKSEMPRG